MPEFCYTNTQLFIKQIDIGGGIVGAQTVFVDVMSFNVTNSSFKLKCFIQ